MKTPTRFLLIMIVVILLVGFVQAGPPVASFTKNQTVGNAPLRVQFNDTSQLTSGTQWLWTWGEEKSTMDYVTYTYWTTTKTSAATRNATHQFSAPGQYQVTLKVTNASGISTSSSQTVTVWGNVTRAPSNSIFRTPVNALPVDANSATYVANTFSGSPADGLRPDPYTPYSVVDSKVPTQYLTSYSDPQTDDVPYPIPEPALQDPYIPNDDQSILIYNKDDNYHYDLYAAEQAGDGTWSASAGIRNSMTSNAIDLTKDRPPYGILPVHYNELADGAVNHMMQLTVERTGGHVWPYSHDGNGAPGYPPWGQVFRLKSTFNVDSFVSSCSPACPQTHAILHGLQTYGGIITDQHGTSADIVLIKIARDNRLSEADLNNLMDVSTSQFEAVDTSSLMVSENSLAVSGYTGDAPVTAFSANATYGTSPMAVKFTDASTNTPTAWRWYWYANETASSTSQSPTTTFTTGSYNIRLNSSNAYGYDWENKTTYITATTSGDPWEGYVPPSITGASPLSITFTDISYYSPTAWNWSFKNVAGNNTEVWFSQVSHPTHIFGQGNYSIRLNASNSGGYNITPALVFVNVTASGAPVVNFTVNRTYVHPGETVLLNDTSTNTPTSWQWSIETNGAGATDHYSTRNVSYVMPNVLYTGPLFVQLNATNVIGTGILRQNATLVVSYEIPISNFTANVTTGTAPLKVGFTATGTKWPKYYQWYWNANETLSSVLATPNTTFTTGVYNVRLYTYNSAGGTWMNKTAYITATPTAPVANFHSQYTSYLVGQDVQMYDDSTNIPTTWIWGVQRPSPGGLYYAYTQNPVIPPFSTAGNYTVNLYAENGGGGNWSNKTGYLHILTGVTPPVAFGSCVPTSGYLPISVTCTDLSTNTPTAWYWVFSGAARTYYSYSRNPTFNLPSGGWDPECEHDPALCLGGYMNIKLTASNSAGSDIWQVDHYGLYLPTAPTPTPTPTPTPMPTSTPSGTGPQIVSASDLTSNGVNFTVVNIYGDNVWIVYGQNSNGYTWITQNFTSDGGTATAVLQGSPLFGNTKYYAKACDISGCGNEYTFSTVAITPAPATNFGQGIRNILGIRW